MEYGNAIAKEMVDYGYRYGLYDGDKPAVYHPAVGIVLTQRRGNRWELVADTRGATCLSEFVDVLPVTIVDTGSHSLDGSRMVYRNQLTKEDTFAIVKNTILDYQGAVPSIDRLWEIERREELEIEYVVFEEMDFDQLWEDEFPLFVGVYCDLQGWARPKDFIERLSGWVWGLDWVVS